MREMLDNKYRFPIAVLLMLSFLSNESTAQFHGGNADGLARVSHLSTICTPIHYNGGPGDGNALLHESGTVCPGAFYTGGVGDGNSGVCAMASISVPFYVSGGNGDGMGFTGAYPSISSSFYCFGGNADGHALTDCHGLTNGIAINCFGGSEDGFALSECLGITSGYAISCFGGNQDGAGSVDAGGTISPPFYCFGGDNDGNSQAYAPAFSFGQGLWSGYVSSNWNNPANWTNNSVPDQGHSVVIPGGCLYYPVITTNFSINDMNWGNIRCSKLNLNPGSSFSTWNQVRVNGELKISGLFHHYNPVDGSFHLTEQGNVRLEPAGSLLIQN